jgi:hypothetical protein
MLGILSLFYLIHGLWRAYAMGHACGFFDLGLAWKSLHDLIDRGFVYMGEFNEHKGPLIPWTFATFFLLMWPHNFLVAKLYFTFWNLAALILIGSFIMKNNLQYGKKESLLLLFSVFAMQSIDTTIYFGQFSIMTLALLIAVLYFNSRGSEFIQGLLLGLALIKPHLSLPFLLVFLVKKKWKVILTALGYACISCLLVWIISGINPIKLSIWIYGNSLRFSHEGTGSLNLLLQSGFNREYIVPLFGLVLITIALVVIKRYKSAPLLIQFSIAAVTARLWTYHRHTDDLILCFLLLSFGQLIFETHSGWATVGFLLTGFSLWIPVGITNDIAILLKIYNFYPLIQNFLWITSLIILLSLEAKKEKLRLLRTS